MEDARRLLHGKKAALFDMDGTLVDSMWIWRQIDIDFLGQRGLPMPDTLHFSPSIGIGSS